MSQPISLSDVIYRIAPSHNSISKLIFNTLELEEKMSQPEEQSEYFNWAMRNNKKILRGATENYDSMRAEFNDYSIDDLNSIREKEKRFLRDEIPSVRPRFVQALCRGACLNRIDKCTNYLQIKSITSKLPAWDDLKDDPDLLIRLIGALE